MTQFTELQQRIIDVLNVQGPMGSQPLFEKVRIAVDRKELSVALHELGPLVKKQSNGQWAVVKSLVPASVAQPAEAPPAVKESFTADTKEPDQEPPEQDWDPLSAIERLETRLKGTVPLIDLKCQALDRLAAILDPEIADLLLDIQADLRRLA